MTSLETTGDGAGGRYHKRDFWSEENLKYAEEHYRLTKSARVINGIAGGRPRTLLDVGCGPAALRRLIDRNIDYYGIDIAVHDSSPRLAEIDFVEWPIEFSGHSRFDIIVAQGVFEYMGGCQRRKFREIANLLSDGGKFVVSYVNFDHRRKHIYSAYNNIQPIREFRAGLEEFFAVERHFPTSHNWAHTEPRRPLVKAVNIHLNVRLPVLTPLLAVEYFFVCSRRG